MLTAVDSGKQPGAQHWMMSVLELIGSAVSCSGRIVLNGVLGEALESYRGASGHYQ
ncbi:MAG: hypothetical protein OXM02_00110 [Bacteroidota bacterium]|nr:hypothetical protein [Bacteroidota bacterium]